jgi:hypothetical protein
MFGSHKNETHPVARSCVWQSLGTLLGSPLPCSIQIAFGSGDLELAVGTLHTSAGAILQPHWSWQLSSPHPSPPVSFSSSAFEMPPSQGKITPNLLVKDAERWKFWQSVSTQERNFSLSVILQRAFPSLWFTEPQSQVLSWPSSRSGHFPLLPRSVDTINTFWSHTSPHLIQIQDLMGTQAISPGNQTSW